ncbi:MAG: tape measure protein, partial [Beijerinckiaceae bacterium]
MAEEVDLQRLIVSLEASTTKYERALQKAQAQTNKQMDAINRASKRPQQGIDQLNRSVDKLSRSRRIDLSFPHGEAMRFKSSLDGIIASRVGINALSASLQGVATALSIAQVSKYADAWLEARNRLAAAGVDVAKVGVAQETASMIAERSRSSFSATVDLYARLTRSSKDLGASQAEIAVVTETVAKALKMSGSTAAESAGAMVQLSQALQSGRLGGDELRSLLEGAPVLAQAIAKEFGVAVGKLKEMGSKGELVADRVFRALVKAAPEVEKSFAKTSATVADTFQQLETAAIRYVGQSQTVASASAVASSAIAGLAKNFSYVANGAAALGIVLAARLIAQGLTPAVVAFAASSRAALAAGAAHIAFSNMIGTSIIRLGAATAAARGLSAALALVGGPIGAAIIGATAAVAYFAVEAQRAEDRSAKYAQALETVRKSANDASPAVRGLGDAVLTASQQMGEAQRNIANRQITQALADQRKAAFELQVILARFPEALRAIGGGDYVRGLELVKTAFNGSGAAALQAREKIYQLANSNPDFQGLADKTDPLLRKLAGISAYVSQLRNQLNSLAADTAQAADKAISSRIPNPTAGSTFDDDANAVNRDPVIRNLQGQGQLRRAVVDAEMDKTAKKIRDKKKELRDAILDAGGTIDPSELDAAARRIVSAGESGGGGGKARKAPVDKHENAVRRMIEALEKEERAVVAEVASFNKSNAEKRTAVELAKAHVDATSDESQRIAALVQKIDAQKTALSGLKQKKEEIARSKDFFEDTTMNALDGIILQGRRLDR